MTMKNLRIEKLKHLSLAALLIASATFVACSSDSDSIIDELQPVNPTGQYTMTIKATKGEDAVTRALTAGSGSISATWTENDVVTVYNVTKNAALEGTLVAQSSGAETTLKGTLTGTIQKDDVLKLMFLSPSYGTQDGTLDYIASNCDYAEATITVSAVSGGNITASDANFDNQQAIVKFTLQQKNNTDNKLNARELKVTVSLSSEAPDDIRSTVAGKLPYQYILTIPDETYTGNGDGIIYLAIPDELEAEMEAQPSLNGYLEFTLTATVGTGDDTEKYTLTKSGFPFKNGKYYEITANLKKEINLNKLTENYKVNDGDVLWGTINSTVTVIVSNNTTRTITLDGVNITHEGSQYPCIYCEGTANATIILAHGSENYLEYKNGTNTRAALQAGNPSTTLTIKGSGQLTAIGGRNCAGIGGGWQTSNWTMINCGNIVIEGGIIIAQGGNGNGNDPGGPGIGPSVGYSCGNITIKNTVTSVTATKGSGATDCIGRSSSSYACGTITIGGTVYWDGSDYVNGGDTYLPGTNTNGQLVYQPQN